MPLCNGAALAGPIPASAGIGLRAPHQDLILRKRPPVGWLEAHSENYFADGGVQVECLASMRSSYPLGLHGVGMSLGSTDPLDPEHLRRLKRLVGWSEPVFISEHLSWGSVQGTYLNDLLPLPYTEESLTHMSDRVDQVQNHLGRQILIENISSYLQFAHSQIPEGEFLAALATESGCGLLLDVNNVYVNACNHGFDAQAYLSELSSYQVQELHLAGHSRLNCADREILIDTHSAAVCDAVWDLYECALNRFGPVPTLIEWDTDIPPLEILMAEADKANQRLQRAYVFIT